MPPPRDLETFCTAQYPRLVGLLGLYCGDRLVAEELAQEALTRTCRDWSRVRVKESPEAWTTRTAINLANSHFRRKKAERRATERLASGQVEPAQPDPSVALDLQRALGELGARQRAVLILHFLCDMSFVQVADVLEMPLSTVKSLSARGVTRLRGNSSVFTLEEAPDGF